MERRIISSDITDITILLQLAQASQFWQIAINKRKTKKYFITRHTDMKMNKKYRLKWRVTMSQKKGETYK